MESITGGNDEAMPSDLASAGIKQLYRLSDADFSFLFKYPLYTHQQRSYASHGNVILSSPTGSGKTETALLWLKHQLEVQGEGRVFYVLPLYCFYQCDV